MLKTLHSCRILYATRAFESPHTEGGYVHLRDLAIRAGQEDSIQPAFFSTGSNWLTSEGLRAVPGLNAPGWNRRISVQFVKALASVAPDFDIIHTAHVPTILNAAVLRRLKLKGSKRGVRYVQTVTALPKKERVRPGLFWGDIVTCLNRQAAKLVERHHPWVTTVPPVPLPARLESRVGIPDHVARRLTGYKLVCFPIELSRLSSTFPIVDVLEKLLSAYDDVHVVVACRFDEERAAERMLRVLLNRTPERLTILGTVSWMLDLFSRSQAVVYPVTNLTKKFNPPLTLLEAAQFGAHIVSTPELNLCELVDPSGIATVTGNDSAGWVGAIEVAMQQPRRSGGLAINFEGIWRGYLDLYHQLQHADF